MEKKPTFIVHSVKYNLIMNMILKISTFIFPLITFPYISRVLGPEVNGRISFATSIIYYFTIFASMGIPTYGIRKCAKVRNNKEQLYKTVNEIFALGTILTVVSYSCLLIMLAVIPKFNNNSILLLICSSTLILSNVGLEWFYQAIEQYDYITLRNLVFKVISVILMFVFVKNPEDYLVYAFIQVLGTVGSNILNLLRIKRYLKIEPFKCKPYDIFQHFIPSAVFFFLTIATTVYTNLDTVMLGFMSGDIQVGYYNAAVKMKNILTSLITALGTVLLPRFSIYIEEKKYEEFKKLLFKSFEYVMLVATPLTIYCILMSKDILLFLAGKEYLPALNAMQFIMPTVFLISLSNITGIQILVPISKEKYTVLSTSFGAIVDLILNILLIPRYGAVGAAIGTLVAEIVVLVSQVYFLKNTGYLPLWNMQYSKIIVSSIVSSIAALLVSALSDSEFVFTRLCFTSLIYFGTYAFLLYITKETLFKSTLDFYAMKIRKIYKRS